MATIYYSDPLFDELYSKIPEDSKRMTAHSFAIASRISDILQRKHWSKTDLANAMGKKNSEISKWMSGQHNFTIETLSKIETVLGEEIISVKKNRKAVTGYTQISDKSRKYLSDTQTKYNKKKQD